MCASTSRGLTPRSVLARSSASWYKSRARAVAFPVVGAREAADDAVFSRPQRLRLLERLNRIVEAAHAEQRDAEIRVRRVRGRKRNRSVEGGDGFGVPPEQNFHRPEIGVGLRIVRRQQDRLTVLLGRFSETSAIAIERRNPGMSGPILRAQRNRSLIGAFRRGKVAERFLGVRQPAIRFVARRI